MDTQFHMMKKERGFILLDLCMAIGIVVIVLALTIPYRAFDREKFLVDQKVRNFAAVMRQSQFMNLGTGRIYTNVFSSDEGDLFALSGVYNPTYIERLDKHIGCSGRIIFGIDGRPKGGMNAYVYTRDERYQRKIVISAQTGRIRISRR